jgi:hypothetical protein
VLRTLGSETFEVVVGGIPIGTFDRDALLASAAAIRRTRAH